MKGYFILAKFTIKVNNHFKLRGKYRVIFRRFYNIDFPGESANLQLNKSTLLRHDNIAEHYCRVVLKYFWGLEII